MEHFKKAVFSHYQVCAVTKLQKVIIDTINDDPCEEVDWDDGKEDCMDDNGDTAYFFEEPKPLPKGTWLLHYTKNPAGIVKNEFHGGHLDHLGLTRGGGKRLEGDHGLAYTLDKAGGDGTHTVGREFGENAILFQSDDAVESWHKSDDEYQVIFDVNTMKNVHALKRSKTFYDVLDSSGKVLFRVEDGPKGFKKAAAKLGKK